MPHKRTQSSSVDIAPDAGMSFTRNRRSSSGTGTLPKHNSPFGVADDYENGATAYSSKSSWMNGSQRSRYLKAGGLIAFVILIFYFLAPSESISYVQGKKNA